jgi:hypothetical protein
MHSRFTRLLTSLVLAAVGCELDIRPHPSVDGDRYDDDAAAAGSPAPLPRPMKPVAGADMMLRDAGAVDAASTPSLPEPDDADGGRSPTLEPDTFGINH